MKWLKVIELTEAGMPHLHCIFLDLVGKRYQLEEDIRKQWLHFSGDSYIVDVEHIKSARRLGNYLGKYLQKSFEHRDEMEALGFIRRWTTSRNWPRINKLVLVDEQGEIYDATHYKRRVGTDHENRYLEKSAEGSSWRGDKLGESMALAQSKRALKAKIKVLR